MTWTFLTPQEAAARLRLPTEKVLALLDEGRLTGARIDDEWRLTPADLEAFVVACGSQGFPRPRRRLATGLLVAALAAAVGLSAGVLAQDADPLLPTVIPYQGRLEGVADGPHELTLRLHGGDGGQLWTSTVVGVQVAAGAFSVNLGAQDPLTNEVLAADDLSLSVAVDGVDLQPRQRLLAVPFALRARRATTADRVDVTSEMVVDGTLTAADVAPRGGIYASKRNVYQLTSPWTPVQPGETGGVTWECADANDLPLGVGCRAGDSRLALNQISLTDWDSTESPAAARCEYYNHIHGAGPINTRTYITCLAVP